MSKIGTTDSEVNRSNVGNPWNEQLCGCCDDVNTCCYGCWCLPCLFGSNAEKIDGSSCEGMCCAYWLLASMSLCCIPHLMKRKVLREKYHLQEEPCGDFLVTAFCGPCAVCQEARELKTRTDPRDDPKVFPVRTQPPTY